MTPPSDVERWVWAEGRIDADSAALANPWLVYICGHVGLPNPCGGWFAANEDGYFRTFVLVPSDFPFADSVAVEARGTVPGGATDQFRVVWFEAVHFHPVGDPDHPPDTLVAIMGEESIVIPPN